jgi:hypothetical protein
LFSAKLFCFLKNLIVWTLEDYAQWHARRAIY